MQNEFQSLADELYRERLLRARRMLPEERMLEGVRIFDRECGSMRVEILRSDSTFSEADVAKEIRRRLKEADAESEATHYRSIPARTDLQ